jgi:hypothetical protein
LDQGIRLDIDSKSEHLEASHLRGQRFLSISTPRRAVSSHVKTKRVFSLSAQPDIISIVRIREIHGRKSTFWRASHPDEKQILAFQIPKCISADSESNTCPRCQFKFGNSLFSRRFLHAELARHSKHSGSGIPYSRLHSAILIAQKSKFRDPRLFAMSQFSFVCVLYA